MKRLREGFLEKAKWVFPKYNEVLSPSFLLLDFPISHFIFTLVWDKNHIKGRKTDPKK